MRLAKAFLTRFLRRSFLRQAKDVTVVIPRGMMLVFAPHPDDETLGCGGTIALHKARGGSVKIVIATDGSNPSLSNPQTAATMASLRRKEALQAAEALGLANEDVTFLPYPDGQAMAHIDALTHDIASQLWLYAPDVVFAPHTIDAHSDHLAVAGAIQTLIKEGKITCPVYEYPIWFWPKGALKHLFGLRFLYSPAKVDISTFLEPKRKAIAAHASQHKEENWGLLEAYGIAANLSPFELFFIKHPE